MHSRHRRRSPASPGPSPLPTSELRRSPGSRTTRASGLDPGGTATGATRSGATLEPGEPPTESSGGSVWFALTSPTSGVYAISVDGGGSSTLDVWTGTSLAGLTRVTGYEGYGPPS